MPGGAGELGWKGNSFLVGEDEDDGSGSRVTTKLLSIGRNDNGLPARREHVGHVLVGAWLVSGEGGEVFFLPTTGISPP